MVLCRKGLEIVMNRLISPVSEYATPVRIRRTAPATRLGVTSAARGLSAAA